jgi:hypothetical protein
MPVTKVCIPDVANADRVMYTVGLSCMDVYAYAERIVGQFPVSLGSAPASPRGEGSPAIPWGMSGHGLVTARLTFTTWRGQCSLSGDSASHPKDAPAAQSTHMIC